MVFSNIDASSLLVVSILTVITSLAYRIIYNLYFHPLAKFGGPWYTACFSLPLAIISLFRYEIQWQRSVLQKYGRDAPIRIAPEMLLFPRPSALKEMYWDRNLNNKSSFYYTGLFGPPQLFTTLSGAEHAPLRKALGAAPWAIGDIRKDWEDKMDEQIILFTKVMTEKAKAGESVNLGDKVAQFAAEIMTIFLFNQPWGFVKNSRDERALLQNWRKGLDFVGFTARFTFFRKHILNIPGIGALVLPKPDTKSGMGYLIFEADRAITEREDEISQGIYPEEPDFLQHILEARSGGEPLTPVQKRSNVTLLIQAGADTTGTTLGVILRFIASTPGCFAKALNEIREAENKNLLSTPIKDEETRTHLPYLVGAVKESMRLQPSVALWLPRTVPPEGKIIEGVFVPGGTDVTSYTMAVQTDPILFAPDPYVFRPERWMEEDKAAELEHGMFLFGMGPRVCLGKDIAWVEIYKFIPEIIRNFDIEVLDEGKYVCAGGLSYNEDFVVKLHPQSVD